MATAADRYKYQPVLLDEVVSGEEQSIELFYFVLFSILGSCHH